MFLFKCHQLGLAEKSDLVFDLSVLLLCNNESSLFECFDKSPMTDILLLTQSDFNLLLIPKLVWP